MQAVEVSGRFSEVVVANNPFCLTEARDLCRDVFFQVDVVGSFSDRRAQQHQSGLFEVGEFSAVTLPPTGHDYRAGSVVEQSLDVDAAMDVVQAQFDQFGALVDQVTMFGDYVPVTAASDANTDHGKEGE